MTRGGDGAGWRRVGGDGGRSTSFYLCTIQVTKSLSAGARRLVFSLWRGAVGARGYKRCLAKCGCGGPKPRFFERRWANSDSTEQLLPVL